MPEPPRAVMKFLFQVYRTFGGCYIITFLFFNSVCGTIGHQTHTPCPARSPARLQPLPSPSPPAPNPPLSPRLPKTQQITTPRKMGLTCLIPRNPRPTRLGQRNTHYNRNRETLHLTQRSRVGHPLPNNRRELYR